MKKALLIAFVAITVLAGCKKDDGPSDKLSESIQGRWDLTKEYYLDKKNGTKTAEGTENYDIGYYYIVFSGNNFKIYDGGQLEDEGTFTISSNEITLDYGAGDIDKNPIEFKSNSEFVVKNTSSTKQGADTYDYYSEETFKKN
ncbi:MAG: lipocalin family protein [Pelobium sp.]